MDDRTVKDLCQRLDELGTILGLMEGEPVSVALHREASDALYQTLSEIERLRSEADLHRETSTRCAMPLLRLNACSRRLPICNTLNLIEVLAIRRR
jgi:hypothetical protein